MEQDLIDEVYDASQQKLTMQTAEVWEELARLSVSRMEIAGRRWKPASRWWGKGQTGKQMEIEVVAESMDGKSILFGEAKWEKKTNVALVMEKLSAHAEIFPKTGGRKIVLAAWCKHPVNATEQAIIFDPDSVLGTLKN